MFVSDVPLSCVQEAAITYQVPARLIIAVLNVEQGKIGLAKRNKNGTYDLGPMQINSSWWPTLARFDVTQQDVQYNPCINIKVGTWILAGAIANSYSLLSGVGDYNSHTLSLNAIYIQKIRVRYTKISQWLGKNTGI